MMIKSCKRIKIPGFTLIELLVVISVIGFLATASVVALNNARKKARDARRLADMAQVQKALELYFHDNNQYPTSDTDGCGGWDVGNKDYQLLNNKLPGIMNKAPSDPTATGDCSGYMYYRYNAGYKSCNSNKGAFYVLGIRDMETSGNPYPGSPGWSCPDQDWQSGMEWVTGKFERP